MQEEKRSAKTAHNVILENRKQLAVSGVLDVDSFDERSVSLFTELGELSVEGGDLHITKLNIESGEVIIQGEITSLEYRGGGDKKGGFFSRLVR